MSISNPDIIQLAGYGPIGADQAPNPPAGQSGADQEKMRLFLVGLGAGIVGFIAGLVVAGRE